MMKKKPSKPNPKNICIQCGQHRSDHILINFNDGPHIGQAYLLCPLPQFKEGK